MEGKRAQKTETAGNKRQKYDFGPLMEKVRAEIQDSKGVEEFIGEVVKYKVALEAKAGKVKKQYPWAKDMSVERFWVWENLQVGVRNEFDVDVDEGAKIILGIKEDLPCAFEFSAKGFWPSSNCERVVPLNYSFSIGENGLINRECDGELEGELYDFSPSSSFLRTLKEWLSSDLLKDINDPQVQRLSNEIRDKLGLSLEEFYEQFGEVMGQLTLAARTCRWKSLDECKEADQ